LLSLSSGAAKVCTRRDGNSHPPYAGARHAHRGRHASYPEVYGAMILLTTIRLLLFFAMQGASDDVVKPLPVHTVNLIADHNSVFRVLGEKREIELVAGEPVHLHVDARKGKSMNRDGSIHGLLLLNSQRKPEPGWDLLFKPGIQEMELIAPTEPGLYEAVCTVICSTAHEQMKLRVVVREK
jgi:hypothetical protein